MVPFHRRLDLVGEALRSVAGWPVLLVDDSAEGLLSDPARQATLRDRHGGPLEVVRTAGSTGFARAANAGLAAAEARGWSWALLLNDDAVLEPGALELLAAERAPGVGALGPVLTGPTGIESAGLDLSWWGRLQARRSLPSLPADTTTAPVPALSGACLLLRLGVRFDEAFAHGMEDLALCRSLWREGRRVLLVPRARCRHEGGATVPRDSARAQRHAVAGHLQLVEGGWRTPVVLGLAAAQALSEGPRGARLRAVWQGWRDHRQG